MRLESPPSRAAELPQDTASASASRPIDGVRRAFLGIEAERDLFGRELGGCRAWDYLRVEVYDGLIGRLGLLGDKQARPDRTLSGYLKEIRGITRSVAWRNPFAERPAELLFVGHPRRRFEDDGCWWDAYSDPLIDGLGRDALLVERPYLHRHLEPAHTARIAHLDALALAAALRRYGQRDPLSRADAAYFDELEVELRDQFGAAPPVCDIARAKLALRKSQLPVWQRLFRRVRPRLVFVVVSYGNEIPIEACRSLGIPTVELQHGVISHQNLGYHFPLPGCGKQLFPDYLFTFGEFWRTAASLPIADERVISVGYPYFERQLARVAASTRREQIVFLSQRSIGAELSRMAVEVARSPERPGEVVYKLHPGERGTWREDYPWLRDAPLRVIEGDAPGLYHLFAESTMQVGVYSTALFEGLAFGLDTRVARLPGCEAMQRMVETTPAASWISDASDIVEAVADQVSAPDVERFFRADAIDNARSAVDEILRGER